MKQILIYILLAISIASCGDEHYTPRPRGYFRINFPEHSYKNFSPEGCPFSFNIPEYATAIPDTNSLAEPCWYYLVLPKFNGQVYLTYKPLQNNPEKYMEDTRTLVYKHTSRASSINEEVMHFRNGLAGILYEIGGDAASPLQFFVTDSTNHFLRGAVYFNAAPNADSISPVTQFVKQDILKLMETVEWK